jgi:DUF1365 family protein
MFYLDLDELDGLFSESMWWSVRRAALLRFKRSDYLGHDGTPLADAVRQKVTEQTGRQPGGPIRLLTHLRQFGYCYNPVSFYYCFDPAGERVEIIVADITNTPWNERHAYIFDLDSSVDAGAHRYRLSKEFHVSPFMSMDHEYDWRFTEPGDNLTAHFENHRQGKLYFDATLILKRRNLTGRAVADMLLHHPFMPARVTAAIYWQALRLWMKRTPFHAHPQKERPTP